MISIDTNLENKIAQALTEFSLTLQDSTRLAAAVQQLSDFYIQNPLEPTPWDKNWAQIAYLVYYLPLNFCRNRKAAIEAQAQNFFADVRGITDFGAGLGSASLALKEFVTTQKFLMIESSVISHKLARHFVPPNWTWDRSSIAAQNPEPNNLLVFSYSLAELEKLPSWALHYDSLMIVEPSTQNAGRKLLQLRDQLIKEQYYIWAPCTHQEGCPLLLHSQKDWCHDRVPLEMPAWFLKMEKHLPFKNKTVTYSYLLAKKSAPPLRSPYWARITGDQLSEKGKDRQLVCRNSEREFLAWMHKLKIRQEIPRGSLIELPTDLEMKANEIRIKNPINVLR